MQTPYVVSTAQLGTTTPCKLITLKMDLHNLKISNNPIILKQHHQSPIMTWSMFKQQTKY